MTGELPPCPCVSGYFPELAPTPPPLGIDVPNRNPEQRSSGTRANGHQTQTSGKHTRWG